VLRSTVLTDKNQIQWNKLMKLVDEMSSAAQSAVDEAVATTTEALSEATEAAMGAMGVELEGTGQGQSVSSDKSSTTVAEASPKTSSSGKSQRGMQAVASLLGSPEGATLRRIAADLDSTDLFLRLISREGRVVRRICAKLLAQKIRAKMSWRSGEDVESDTERLSAALASEGDDEATAAPPATTSTPLSEAQQEAADRLARMYGTSTAATSFMATSAPSSSTSASAAESRLTTMPVPDEFRALQARQKRWTKTMTWQLLSIHFRKQWAAGWRGVYGVGALIYVTIRVITEAAARAVFGLSRDLVTSPLRWVRKRGRRPKRDDPDSESATVIAMAGGLPVIATSPAGDGDS
jgi:hypothetical protein